MISKAPQFVLRFSKDERRVFQQNHIIDFIEVNEKHLSLSSQIYRFLGSGFNFSLQPNSARGDTSLVWIFNFLLQYRYC